MVIKFKHKGDFSKLSKYLNKSKNMFDINMFNRYGEAGVSALASATPMDTGRTAMSWRYEIFKEDGIIKIAFLNDNINKGVQIAVILQYGHATKNGGWVEGIDYINPAIRPVFDEIVNDAWKEVKKL